MRLRTRIRSLRWRFSRWRAGKPRQLTDEEWVEIFNREHARAMESMGKFVEDEFFKKSQR